MMKKSSVNINYIGCLTIIAALFISSCKKEDTYDVMGGKENKVYINTQSWAPVGAPENTVFFDLTNTPLSSMVSNSPSTPSVDNPIVAKFAVQCSKPAENDINVKLELDNSLMRTSYNMFPKGVRYTIDHQNLVIPAGSTISQDSVTITVNKDDLMLITPGSYMIPFKIVSADNASLSTQNAAYLVVRSTYTNLTTNVTTVPVGAVISRTAWTVLPAQGWVGTLSSIIDASTTTYAGATTFPLVLEIDLGAEYTNITGFAIRNSSSTYAILTSNVSSKTSSGEYVAQGNSILTASTTRYVNFVQPITARFVKMEILTATATGVRLADFNVYRKP